MEVLVLEKMKGQLRWNYGGGCRRAANSCGSFDGDDSEFVGEVGRDKKEGKGKG